MRPSRLLPSLPVIVLLAGCQPLAPPELEAVDDNLAPTGQAALLASVCSGCHLAGGDAITGLEGLSSAELAATLRTYRNTSGPSAMHRMAAGYDLDEIEALAAFLSAGGNPDE